MLKLVQPAWLGNSGCYNLIPQVERGADKNLFYIRPKGSWSSFYFIALASSKKEQVGTCCLPQLAYLSFICQCVSLPKKVTDLLSSLYIHSKKGKKEVSKVIRAPAEEQKSSELSGDVITSAYINPLLILPLFFLDPHCWVPTYYVFHFYTARSVWSTPLGGWQQINQVQ